MAYEKLLKMIKVLAKKTELGEIEWQETGQEGSFQAAFPSYAVRVFTRPNYEQPEGDIVLQIYNERGALVEEVSDAELVDPAIGLKVPDAYRLMKSLYESARRKAMGIEQALDQILEQLGEPPF